MSYKTVEAENPNDVSNKPYFVLHTSNGKDAVDTMTVESSDDVTSIVGWGTDGSLIEMLAGQVTAVEIVGGDGQMISYFEVQQ